MNLPELLIMFLVPAVIGFLAGFILGAELFDSKLLAFLFGIAGMILVVVFNFGFLVLLDHLRNRSR